MHSNGPWTIDRQGRGDFGVYISIEDSGGMMVASDVCPNDAHLIAAAPEMLEALKAMLEVHNEPCRLDHHGLCQTHHLRRNEAGEPECEVKLARAAISKAKGEGRGE